MSKKVFKKFFLSMAMIFIITLIGCSNSDEAGSNNSENDEDTISIGFSFGMNLVKHWETEVKGAEDAAKDAGVKLEWKSADLNEQTQISDIENMIQSGIDGLLVAPANSEGIVPTIEEAKEKYNLPVASVDIGVDGTDVVSHIASDNYEIGQMAAEYLAELTGGKGNYAMITWPTASATKDREEGFLDKISEYPDINIITTQDSNGDRNQALMITENILQEHPDLDAIFGVNESAAMGAYGAVSAANIEVPIMGVDSSEDLTKAIKAGGNLKATIAQNPYEMGYQAAKTLIDAINGNEVEESISIPVDLVTIENVDEMKEREEAYLAD